MSLVQLLQLPGVSTNINTLLAVAHACSMISDRNSVKVCDIVTSTAWSLDKRRVCMSEYLNPPTDALLAFYNSNDDNLRVCIAASRTKAVKALKVCSAICWSGVRYGQSDPYSSTQTGR